MREELRQQLFDTCPIIYRHQHSPHKDNAFFRWMGFRCGEGWFDLLLELSIDIENEVIAHRNKHDVEMQNLPYVVQVKEKFGGLNFYMSRQNDKISKLIFDAAKRSETTCERCGMFAKTRRIHGWCYTECRSCHEQRLDDQGY